jgi:hypothetical protein
MLQNIPKEKILEVVREGPTIPTKIVKRVGGDTMLIGAILSTLVHSGDVLVSSLKIGGSPLYYIKADEQKLENFADHLNDKDRKTLNMLKEQKLLRDSEQDPLIRVSLRTLKDFAKSFEIDIDGKKELFWRYNGYNVDQASAQAATMLRPQETIVVEKTTVSPRIVSELIQEKVIDEAPKITITNTITSSPTKKSSTKTEFFERIHDYFHNQNLDIISKEKLKKTEYNLVVKNHETNEYIFCKAKDKKTISDGDLATAFVFAHSKNMSCMFLTTGTLTKKAESMIHKEFKEMKIEQI